MQDPEHQKSKCPVTHCRAGRGEPCVTVDGLEADRVHHARPYWSSKVIHPWERSPDIAIVAYVQGGWGPCDRCAHWMIRDSGLSTVCVVCRSAA